MKRFTLVKVALLSSVLSFAFAEEKAQLVSAPLSREDIKFSFSQIVKKACPAVVNIYTKQKIDGRAMIMDDPFFGEFFNHFGMDVMPSMERVQKALGSGVIVRQDGLVITNHHIVDNASEINIVTNDGKEYEAKVIVDDEKADLALLRIKSDKKDFPFLELRDVDSLEVGDLVLAIGNPFGMQHSVSNGIISALARTRVGEGRYKYYIQTDTAINRGNSGGALISIDGRLIGINTFIVNPSMAQGIGFAIPANLIKTLVASADNGGKISRPWLGIRIKPMKKEESKTVEKGAHVAAVEKNGPAEKAGIQSDDIITQVDDKTLEDEQALLFRIATHSVGDKVKFRIMRKGKSIDITASLEAQPENVASKEGIEITGNNPFAGTFITNLTPEIAQESKVPIEEKEGVVVTKIGRNSVSSQFLQQGDILLKINDVVIKRVEDVAEALKNPGKMWKVSYRRGIQLITIQFNG